MPYIVQKTITETFHARAKTTPKADAFQYKTGNKWITVSFKDFYEECEEISFGLMALGIEAENKVALLSSSRYEWVLCDMAILGAKAISVPIYASSTADDVAYILNHSESRIVFVENEPQLQKVLGKAAVLPKLEKIILLTGKGDASKASAGKEILPFSALREQGRRAEARTPSLFEQNLLSAKPEDTITLCYTSGTTGVPKGAILTHANLMSVLADCCKCFGPFLQPEKETDLLYLPFSHIIGKVESMAPHVFGWKGAFAESMDHLTVNLPEIRPTVLFAVPRIFEKAHNRIQAMLEAGNPLKQKLFHWALDVSAKNAKTKENKKSLSLLAKSEQRLAQKLVFSKIAARFGGRLRLALCGGAPLAPEIARFFQYVGIDLLQGYGLTETCGPVTLNSPDANRIGSVGRPLGDVAIKIAEDGEILIQSKKIFQGYFKMPSETAACLEEGGWFRTGDIGHIDSEGYLHITDRKKDLIVTSGGKNIAPQKIENLMKTKKFINQFVAHGDRRNYLTALVTLDRDSVIQYAHDNKILFSDYAGLLQNPKIQSLIQKQVDEVNAGIAPFERIKKFILLPNDFTVEAGELTPSLKVKRNVIEKKFKAELDRMYESDGKARGPIDLSKEIR